MAAVTFPQVVEHVRQTIEPVWDHVRDHDAWHLAQIEADKRAGKSDRIAIVSLIIAGLATLAAIVEPLLR